MTERCFYQCPYHEADCPADICTLPLVAEGGSRKRALVEEDTMTRSMMLSVLEEEEESDEPPTKVKRPSDAGKCQHF